MARANSYSSFFKALECMAHPGIVAMHSLAKMYEYWIKIGNEIEDLAQSCERC